MSFNKKSICIFLILVLAALLVGCAGQTAAPTATVVPTVEEPTAVPEEPAAEPVKETVTEAAVEETTEEKPEAEIPAEATAESVAEEAPAEAASAETVEEAPAAGTVEEVPAEAASAETVEEAPAAGTVEEVPAEAASAETVEEAPAAGTVEEAPAEEASAEAAEETADEKPAADIAASVDGEEIPVSDFSEMAIFNRYQYLNMYYQYAQMYSMYNLPLDSLDAQVEGILNEEGRERMGSEVIDQLTYNKVLELEAANAGLEISNEDVMAQLKQMFSYEEPSAEEESLMGLDSFNVDPIITESSEDKDAAFKTYAESILAEAYGGAVSYDFLKDYAKNILLDNRMFASELEDRVFEAEMVSARHILVEDEETALDIKAKLDAGEDWAALASEHSLDTSNKDNSGDLGWFGRGEMVSEFEEAAFALEPGQISDPVKTAYGYHIIASDGKELRPLNGSALEAAQNEAYDEWSVNLRTKHDIRSYPENWLEAVPMEPAFVSLNPTSKVAEETAENTEAVTEEAAEPETETAVVAAEPEAEAAAEPEAETAAEPEAEAAAEPEAETAAEPEAETAAEPEAETAAEPEAETAAEPEAETAAEPEAETAAEPEAEAATEPEAETAAEPEAEAATEPEAETAAEPEAETAAEPEAETAAEPVVVAVMNGTEITGDEFVEEAYFYRYQLLSSYSQYAQYASMIGFSMTDINEHYQQILGEEGKEQLGNSVIDRLVYSKMLETEAAEMGVTVTQKDAVQQMKQMLGYTNTAAEAESSLGLDSFNIESDIDTESEEDKAFRAETEMEIALAFQDRISYDYYLEYVRHGMLENAVIEKLMEGKDTDEEQVNARHILVENEETAKEILSKLEAGEEWDALAAEYSLDTGNKDKGGALGWFGRGVMVTEFEDAAFALEPGKISEPVKTSFGWHIIASDGKEMRPMDEDALKEYQSELFEAWYNDLKEKYEYVSYPEVWLPLVPMEPEFVPVETGEKNDDDDSIPTLHIISEDEEDGENSEDDLTIQNTEQDPTAYTINNDAETEIGSEPEPGDELEAEDEDLTISNTEQTEDAILLTNDAENN